MVERCNVSGQDQGDSFDNGVDWAAFGELRTRCDDVSEPWLTDVDIYDEKGPPAAFDERSMTTQEACETGVYHLAGGCVVPILRQTRRALRWESALVSGGLYRELHSYITMKSQLGACQLRDSGPGNAHDPGSIVNGQT